jgi:hypothetical protein
MIICPEIGLDVAGNGHESRRSKIAAMTGDRACPRRPALPMIDRRARSAGCAGALVATGT